MSRLDHVAHAVPRWQDVWHRYAVDLGATWSSGGLATGFAPGQIEFANGARLELLMPNDADVNDFLQRFIARNGPGPHHLTFKVPDLALALEQTRQAGYEPIGIDLTDPEWMEAFIHPKQATGVVVQLAQAATPWTGPPPDDFPTSRRQRADGTGPVRPASLRWVTHAVAELDIATPLFVGLLGGRGGRRGDLPDHRWMELTWGGPMGLRLVSPVGHPSAAAPAVARRAGPAGSTISSSAPRSPDGIAGAVPEDGTPARHRPTIRHLRATWLGRPARGECRDAPGRPSRSETTAGRRWPMPGRPDAGARDPSRSTGDR